MRKNQLEKGSAAVFFCLLLPVILAIAGMCIDGSYLLYKKAELGSATKFAAISATAFYHTENGRIIIDSDPAEGAAETTLKKNCTDAWINQFTIQENECTVDSALVVTFFFVRIFGIHDTRINESYSACRRL